jgi:hypothetical protein
MAMRTLSIPFKASRFAGPGRASRRVEGARKIGLAALMVGLGASCASEPREGARGTELAISVSALTLVPVLDADYKLAVRNGQGQLVWERDHLRSITFGDGAGSLAYIGTCDASSNDNVVELWVNDLYSAPGVPLAAGSWRNPTEAGPIRQTVRCVENADLRVAFDLTFMRSANQGFFDIGVQFSDVFCSAKVDCVDALLHRPNGARGPTVNVAFACTAGEEETWLHYSDVAAVCGTRTTWLDPHVGPGQVGAQGPGVYQLATYRGREQLGGYDKCYWNLGIGLDLGADTRDCKLVGYATASDASFGDGRRTPPGSVHPFVRFEVPLTGADGAFLASCGEHRLDAPGSGVQSDYTEPSGTELAWEWACDEAATITESRLLCGTQSGPEAASFVSTPGGVVFSLGAKRSPLMKLPAGLALDGCCGNPCPGCE